MSGDTKNASQWHDADVWIDFSGTAADPEDTFTAYASGWEAVGLLDGAEGFEEERDEETSESYAWGGVLVRKRRSKHKRTIKFVAMEDNPTTFRLVNPGSTRAAANGDDVVVSTVKIPKYEDFRISFSTVDGDKVRRRTAAATIEEIGSIASTEEEPEVYEITVLILPEADGTLWTDLTGPAVAPTP